MKIMGVDIKKMFKDLGSLISLYDDIVNFRNDHKNYCTSVTDCNDCNYTERIDCSYNFGYLSACDDILELVEKKIKGVSNEM